MSNPSIKSQPKSINSPDYKKQYSVRSSGLKRSDGGYTSTSKLAEIRAGQREKDISKSTDRDSQLNQSQPLNQNQICKKCHNKKVNSKQSYKISYRPRLGVTLLITVNIIWSVTSEFKTYAVNNHIIENYDKPYLLSWVSMSLYSFYLLGFIFYPPWRRQCIRCACYDDTGVYSPLSFSEEEEECENFHPVNECQHEECRKRCAEADINQNVEDGDQIESNSKDPLLPSSKNLEQTREIKCLYQRNLYQEAFSNFSEPELIKAFNSDADSIITASTERNSSINSDEEEGENENNLKLINSSDVDSDADDNFIDINLNDNSSQGSQNGNAPTTPLSRRVIKKKKIKKKRGVKFNKLKEVVKLFDSNDAWMARMSYFSWRVCRV